jgi:hypothetical protein
MLPVIPPKARATKKKRPRAIPNASAAKKKRPAAAPSNVAPPAAAPFNDDDDDDDNNNKEATDTVSNVVATKEAGVASIAPDDVDAVVQNSAGDQDDVAADGDAAIEQQSTVAPAINDTATTANTFKPTAPPSKIAAVNDGAKKKAPVKKIAKKIIRPVQPKKKKVIISNPIMTAVATSATNSSHQQQQQLRTAVSTATTNGRSMGVVINNNGMEDDDTLLMAAEAAAALIENAHNNNNNTNNSTTNLLDAVGNQVELAAAAMGQQQHHHHHLSTQGEEGGGGGGLMGQREHDTDQDMMTAFECEFGDSSSSTTNHGNNDNNNISSTTSGNNNKRGNNFLTFSSRVPQNQPLSMEHTNFLSYYYSNESAGHNATARGSGKKKDEDEEEVVVDEGDDEEGGVGGRKGGGGGGGAAATMSSTANSEEGDNDASMAVLPTPMVTLKSFCSKFPKGSSNKGKKAKTKNKRGVKNEEEEEAEKELLEAASATAETSTAENATTATDPAAATTATTTNNDGPQVEIINGEIVISQNSLLSHPETRTSTEQIDKEFGTVVEDETPTQLGAINARYDSYITKPRSRPQRWTAEETKSFYRALRQCGTDFSMMQMFLEGRTRSQLKSKYKLELRKNGRLVDMALDPKSKLKLDLSVFGDGLEIPESVTPISRVSPSLVDGGGKLEEDNDIVGEVGGEGGENAAAAAAAQGATIIERNFDHLFDDDEEIGVKEDTTKISQEVINPVVEEVAPKNAPVVSESIPLALAPSVKKAKSKRPRAKPKAKRAATKK